VKIIKTTAAPAAIGSYSQAIFENGVVYVSGQIPVDAKTGMLVAGGIYEQVERVVLNLEAVLVAAGSNLNSVVKTTCFLTDMNDFDMFNEVYAKYFICKPARSCVAVMALPKGALVEIDAIAVCDVSLF